MPSPRLSRPVVSSRLAIVACQRLPHRLVIQHRPSAPCSLFSCAVARLKILERGLQRVPHRRVLDQIPDRALARLERVPPRPRPTATNSLQLLVERLVRHQSCRACPALRDVRDQFAGLPSGSPTRSSVRSPSGPPSCARHVAPVGHRRARAGGLDVEDGFAEQAERPDVATDSVRDERAHVLRHLERHLDAVPTNSTAVTWPTSLPASRTTAPVFSPCASWNCALSG